MNHKIRFLLAAALLGASSQTYAQATAVMCTGEPCATLSQQTLLYKYLSTGIGGSPTSGLLANQAAANTTLAKGVANDVQAVPNADAMARDRAAKDAVLQRYADATKMPTAASCRRSASASVGGGGGSSGGGSGAGDEVAANDEDVKRYQKPAPTLASAADLVTGDQVKFCTAENVLDKTPGCAKAGEIPGANMHSTWLRFPARKAGNESSVSHATIVKGSLSHQAATSYIAMVSAMPATSTRDNFKNSPEGRLFLAYRQRYSGRATTATSAMNGVLARSMAGTTAPLLWSSQADEYKTLYPKFKFPTNPSEYERDRFSVDSLFLKKAQDDDKSLTGDALIRRLLEVQKINARQALRAADAAEQNSILLSALLANAIDPVTREKLDAMAAAARSKNDSGTK